MTGLTSVTFRQFSVDEIIHLTAKAELDGIEWGSDVHAPVGNLKIAQHVGEQTRAAGLQVLSYGSYYKLCQTNDPVAEFKPVLRSAKALGAPNIRIWAGTCAPDQADETYYCRAAQELKTLCRMAESITISLEYHRGTLTENAKSTMKLLEQANCENLRTYWQPNPDVTHEENCLEVARVRPYVSNIHVFQWHGNNIRYKLAEGCCDWQAFIRTANMDLSKISYILEFVKDDSPEIFVEDAATLKCWLKECEA